jgi:hypothetical protein
VLRANFFSGKQVMAIVARDYDTAGLEPAEVALMAFADKVVVRAYEVTQEDIDELRRHGFSDEDILDIALTAASRSFFSKDASRRQSSSSKCRATNGIPSRDQLQDRQGPRPHDPPVAAGAGGSGHRVTHERGAHPRSMKMVSATGVRGTLIIPRTYRSIF